MAITTYTELKTAISNWTNRSDLTAVIPDFIALAESRIKKTLRTLGDEKSAFAETVAGEERIAVPSDFNGMRTLFVRGNPKCQLDQVSLDKLRRTYSSNATGRPVMFALSADQLYLGYVPDSNYTLEMNYYAFEALSDSVSTNTILTKYPDVYLSGSLAEAHSYLNDTASHQEWLRRYEMAVIEAFRDQRILKYGAQLKQQAQVVA